MLDDNLVLANDHMVNQQSDHFLLKLWSGIFHADLDLSTKIREVFHQSLFSLFLPHNTVNCSRRA